MVTLLTDAQGTRCAIHRTYLLKDGSGKAHVIPAKASLGQIWGCAIRLDPAGRELVVGEGVETAASAGLLLGLPAWSACSAGNLARGLVLPSCIRSVVIAVDRDPPGEKAAEDASHRWQAEGRRVRLAWPALNGTDFNDVLVARQTCHD